MVGARGKSRYIGRLHVGKLRPTQTFAECTPIVGYFRIQGGRAVREVPNAPVPKVSVCNTYLLHTLPGR